MTTEKSPSDSETHVKKDQPVLLVGDQIPWNTRFRAGSTKSP